MTFHGGMLASFIHLAVRWWRLILLRKRKKIVKLPKKKCGSKQWKGNGEIRFQERTQINRIKNKTLVYVMRERERERELKEMLKAGIMSVS